MKIVTMCPQCGSIAGHEKTDRTGYICPYCSRYCSRYCSTKRITVDFDYNMLGETDDDFSIAEQKINQQFLFHLPTFDKVAYENRLKEEQEDAIKWQKGYDEFNQEQEERKAQGRENICKINNVDYDLTAAVEVDKATGDVVKVWDMVQKTTGMSREAIKGLPLYIHVSKIVPATYKVDIEDRNNPKCPNCKSTAITAGQRGFSIITGFWGSGNTVNRCAACGHKWKP